ncbi:MAG: hypothetical protein VKL42_11200 [Snowella sp.]|nr:hypothetical protein [Snowella sp.]
MSKTPFESVQNQDDDLLSEYNFDYRKVKPNRFASRNEAEKLTVVVLDEDVAQVFTTPESVNNTLRSLIRSIPPSASEEVS